MVFLLDVLRVQLSEFTHRLGWQILSIDHYPRFDPITTFMNRALIPIGIIAGIFMLFLAYWSSTMSSSSFNSSEGWMVSGSTGGKNAALRRTLEIIQEQKYHQEQERRLQMAIERKEALAFRTALAENGKGELVPNPGNGKPQVSTAPTNNISIESSDPMEFDEDGNVPEIVIMHALDSSRDTIDLDNPYNQRKLSHGRGKGSGRRLSSIDEIKRKQRHSIFGGSSRPDRQKRWKTGSLMLSHLGSKDGKM
uniref:Uncharacterized protein n=1 Tax=Panagrolaimus davidi TaxID=227884 RepID=A0A914P899_9BILA